MDPCDRSAWTQLGAADTGGLTGAQIEGLLGRGTVGRIGCRSGPRVVISPITYVYDGAAAFGCSFDGLKVRAMRADPRVCFEVEETQINGDVGVVTARADYTELAGSAAEDALALFRLRYERLLSAARMPAPEGTARAILYRLDLSRKTGRIDSPLGRLALALQDFGRM